MKKKAESTNQTHFLVPLYKGKTYGFIHRFMGEFTGVLMKKFNEKQLLIKLTTKIRYAHYNFAKGNTVYVVMGNVLDYKIVE